MFENSSRKRIYNSKRKKYKRGINVEEGKFVIGVNNWIVNFKGEFLVQKRSRNKRNNPNKWSSTNGLRKIGEESIATCIRETEEELGVNISNAKIKFMGSKIVGENLIADIFLTLMNLDVNDITIQKEEVEEIRWVIIISTTCSYIKTYIMDFIKVNKEK